MGVSIQEAKEYGRVLALSKLFGTMSEEAGTLLAMHLTLHNLSAFDYKREWHLVKGNPSMRADTMLAKFHELGHQSKIIERSSKRAAIELKRSDGSPETFSFTWEEAMKEPIVYNGEKESEIIDAIESGNTSKLAIKSKYRTERARMQMLWARVVSDGVRAIAPEVNFGTYTPEEADDFQGGESSGETVTAMQPKPAPVKQATTIATVAQATAAPAAKNDTPLAVAPEGAAEISRERAPPKSTEPATADQVKRAQELMTVEKQRTPTAINDYRNKLATNGAGNLKMSELYGWELQGLIDAVEQNRFVDWMADISTIYNRTPF